jgi:uncharacterized protein (DUF1810 family)
MFDLSRFKRAQDSPSTGFAAALAEIRAGGKIGHWIWYVFPQHAGLGRSAMSREYGISSVSEARAYLQDDLLRQRLSAVTSAVAEQMRAGASIRALMGGSLDAQKLVSSLTLFAAVARELASNTQLEYQRFAETADEVLARAQAEGYPGCTFTLQMLERTSVDPDPPRR